MRGAPFRAWGRPGHGSNPTCSAPEVSSQDALSGLLMSWRKQRFPAAAFNPPHPLPPSAVGLGCSRRPDSGGACRLPTAFLLCPELGPPAPRQAELLQCRAPVSPPGVSARAGLGPRSQRSQTLGPRGPRRPQTCAPRPGRTSLPRPSNSAAPIPRRPPACGSALLARDGSTRRSPEPRSARRGSWGGGRDPAGRRVGRAPRGPPEEKSSK